MFGFGKKKASARTAHNRLKVAINADRINLPPEKIKELEKKMRKLINEYIPVKNLNLNKDYNESSLDLLKISVEVDKSV